MRPGCSPSPKECPENGQAPRGLRPGDAPGRSAYFKTGACHANEEDRKTRDGGAEAVAEGPGVRSCQPEGGEGACRSEAGAEARDDSGQVGAALGARPAAPPALAGRLRWAQRGPTVRAGGAAGQAGRCGPLIKPWRAFFAGSGEERPQGREERPVSRSRRGPCARFAIARGRGRRSGGPGAQEGGWPMPGPPLGLRRRRSARRVPRRG